MGCRFKVRKDRRRLINFKLSPEKNLRKLADKIYFLEPELRLTCMMDLDELVNGHMDVDLFAENPWIAGINIKKLYEILKQKGMC